MGLLLCLWWWLVVVTWAAPELVEDARLRLSWRGAVVDLTVNGWVSDILFCAPKKDVFFEILGGSFGRGAVDFVS